MTVDLQPDAAAGSGIGRNELGTVSVADRVVTTLAARAAMEVPDAGAAAPRVLGRSVGGGGAVGLRETDLDALPKTSAEVDGATVVVTLQISVRWPASVPDVADAVRRHVVDRVHEQTGLTVTDVTISVTDLVTDLAPLPRVR